MSITLDQEKSVKRYTKQQIIEHARETCSDMDLLDDLMFDRVWGVETIDGCTVEMDGRCPHGYPSPILVMGLI